MMLATNRFFRTFIPVSRRSIKRNIVCLSHLFNGIETKTQKNYSSCGQNGSLKDQLFSAIAEPSSSQNKVTIIGAGQVGMASAICILSKHISNELCLIDAEGGRLEGEMLELQHSSTFVKDAKISSSTDLAFSANSKIVIVTAGARQREGESRLDLVQRNTDIFKDMIPQLVKYSPNMILIIVTNPVDVLSFVAWKLSGLPKSRVIGSGTNLDSARFSFFLSQRLNIAPSSCHGLIIGEHGDTSVPVWSGVNVAGVKLRDWKKNIGTENDPENWNELHSMVVQAAHEVINRKGYTNWAIGLSVSDLTSTILANTDQIRPVSTMIQGLHGIKDEVFLSLPCSLGSDGIAYIVKQKLTDKELELLCKSASVLYEIQCGLKF